MSELSPINRPFTLREIARGLRIPVSHLERLIATCGINPACRIGGMRVYGPAQMEKIADAMAAETV